FLLIVGTVGRCDLNGQPIEIIVDLDIAYVLSGHYLDIIDITDPENPAVINSWETPGRASAMALYDDHVYLTAADSGFVVVNISDPYYIYQVGSVPAISSVAIAISYPYSYVHSSTGIKVIDIQIADNPFLAGEAEDLDNGEKDLEVHGSYVFVTYESSGLNAFELSDPLEPSFVNSLLNYSDHISIQGELAFVSEHIGTRVFVVDISNPASWSGMWGGRISAFVSYDRITGLTSNGNYFFVGHPTEGHGDDEGREIIEIVDYSEPDEPSRVAYIEATGYSDGVRCLAAQGDCIFSGTVSSDFIIYSCE
ncbi:hypothetical protein JW877_06415, partial [bacterium]|nr:hypothetical protein [bacterium]